MIVSTLEQSGRIEPLHPLFKTLFDYVKSHDLLNAPLGRIEIDGDNLFINNVELEGACLETQPLEMHREYIDVHILLKGRETVGWKDTARIARYSKEYSSDGDCALSDERADVYVDMQAGDFMVVYPEDAHAPAISDAPIRKLIAKVRNGI